MRRTKLIVLRTLSLLSGFVSLSSSIQLAIGIYALLAVQGNFPDATASQLGSVHGRFIGAPLFGTLVFAALAYALWRFSRRFLANTTPNTQSRQSTNNGSE